MKKRGRPVTPGGKKFNKLCAFRIPLNEFERFAEAAQTKGIGQSELIRVALDHYLTSVA